MNKESDLDLDLSTVVILIFNPLEKRARVSQMKFHICVTRFLPAGLVHYILFALFCVKWEEVYHLIKKVMMILYISPLCLCAYEYEF